MSGSNGDEHSDCGAAVGGLCSGSGTQRASAQESRCSGAAGGSPPASVRGRPLTGPPGADLRSICLTAARRCLAQVVPSELGRQQKPWFLLQPSYWRRRAADAEHEKLLAHMLSSSTADKGVAVAISNLRKTYGGARGGDKRVRPAQRKPAGASDSVEKQGLLWWFC